jgi:hypothetical protein
MENTIGIGPMSSESCACTPGYAGGNQAGAVVRNAVDAARRADRLALLGRYREQRCCVSTSVSGSASSQIFAATVSNDISGYVLPSNRIDRLVERVVALGPKGNAAVLTSGVYTDNLRREVIEASKDPFNPETRFQFYERYQPPAPCPTYVRNPAVPKAPDAYCYPTRFTGNPRY